jgi:hypothetical protein
MQWPKKKARAGDSGHEAAGVLHGGGDTWQIWLQEQGVGFSEWCLFELAFHEYEWLTLHYNE